MDSSHLTHTTFPNCCRPTRPPTDHKHRLGMSRESWKRAEGVNLASTFVWIKRLTQGNPPYNLQDTPRSPVFMPRQIRDQVRVKFRLHGSDVFWHNPQMFDQIGICRIWKPGWPNRVHLLMALVPPVGQRTMTDHKNCSGMALESWKRVNPIQQDGSRPNRIPPEVLFVTFVGST